VLLALALITLSQTARPVKVQQDGVQLGGGWWQTLDCVAPVVCDRTASTGVVTITSSGGGGGAPTNAEYITYAANASLSAERTLTGTANQVTLTNTGTNMVLSTPQDIATTSGPTFAQTLITNYVQMANASTPATPTGALRLYSTDEDGWSRLETVGPNAFVIRYGRDAITIVRNNTGSTITKGRAVALATNSNANLIRVVLADATSTSNLPCVGFMAADCTNGSNCPMQSAGVLTGLDTSAFTDGDRIFTSTTAGGITATAPTHPNLQQRVGVVINSNASSGTLFVAPAALFGDQQGTNLSNFSVGPGTGAAAVTQTWKNANAATITWTPTAVRTLTLPDTTGTVALTSSNVATATALAADPTDCGANQYATTIAASGNLTCAQVTTAQLSGTITNGQLASTYSGVGACGANTFASTLNGNAAPTCTQPSFANLSGSATTAQLPTITVPKGGTNLTTVATNQVLVGTAADTYTAKTVPSCSGASSALTYDNATQTWGCNTISGGAGSGKSFEQSVVLTDTGIFTQAVALASTTATDKFACRPFGTTADGLTMEVIAAAELSVVASDLVAGVGLNITVINLKGLGGTVRIHCTTGG